jgi:cobalamin biosynthesis protein CbiG
VTGYRLYGLDGVNKVASGEWIEADDDETAIEVAKKMMDGHDCELWQGPRLVARILQRRRD